MKAKRQKRQQNENQIAKSGKSRNILATRNVENKKYFNYEYTLKFFQLGENNENWTKL